jgi:two-component system, NtrC family, response regulator
LRERLGDIKELIFHYINKICQRHATEAKGFSPEFMEALCTYNWPGNVRELINALESAVSEALSEDILYRKHLPTHIRVRLIREAVSREQENETPPVKMTTLKELREAVLTREYRQYFQELMTLTGGDTQEACKISGLGRTQFYQLLKKYGS